MTSVYNRLCENFFTINLFEIGWLAVVWNYTNIKLVFLGVWIGGGDQIAPRKKLSPKSPALLELRLSFVE